MKDEYGHEMTESHSEKEIYKGCLSLMESLSEYYLQYMEDMLEIDFKEMPEEERPNFRFTPTEIVERLFLWTTTHSGGTSQHMKCNELGIDTDDVAEFGYEEDKCCDTCDYCASFEGVCVNELSEHCADFVDSDDCCEHWENKERCIE